MSGELQNLIFLAAETLKSFGAREVYVFGSAAKGRFTASSDLDIAVSGVPAQTFFRAMAATEDAIQRSVDLVDLDENTPFVSFLRQQGGLLRVA